MQWMHKNPSVLMLLLFKHKLVWNCKGKKNLLLVFQPKVSSAQTQAALQGNQESTVYHSCVMSHWLFLLLVAEVEILKHSSRC